MIEPDSLPAPQRSKSIEEVIGNFPRQKVVVIGDVMVDEYIQGKVNRLSPEVPAPLLSRDKIPSLKDDLVRLGGAGNTARNIASFGAEVILIGVCGDDSPACDQLMDLAASHSPDKQVISEQNNNPQAIWQHRLQIRCEIVKQSGLITTHKLRLIDSKFAQLFRIDTEKKQVLNKRTVEQVLRRFRTACNWADIVVVSDYAKGLITEDFFKQLRKIAKKKYIIVDPKELVDGAKFDKYIGAEIIIPNEKELRKSFGYPDETKMSLEELFSAELPDALKDNEIKGIICTRGPQGVFFSDLIDRAKSITGKDVEVADVTGASDTVTATVALAYAQFKDLKLKGSKLEYLKIAATIAEAAGRLKVTKRLTGTVQTIELLHVIDPMIRRRAKAKLYLKHTDFIEACERPRKNNPKCHISLITGCFDILHRGHLKLIEHAAEKADIVVVAVNSDDYILRSPHKIGGPYLDEISRATLVASLECVDIVTVFDDDTPEFLISEIRPSLLVMGEEYKQQRDNGTLPGMNKIPDLTVDCIGWDETRTLSSSAIAEKVRQAPSILKDTKSREES